MSDRNSPFQAELDQVISQPKREFVDQPRDEALKLAQAPAAKKIPWSKYVPFPAGTELAIKGGVNIPFIKNITIDGSGTVEARTDDNLVFSFNVSALGQTIGAKVTVNYKEDGGTNTMDFKITSTGQKGTGVVINIQSLENERIVTPIGGLEIETNAPFFPLPDKVTLKAVHIRPGAAAIELEAEVAGLPNTFVQATKKPAETTAKK
jgi:hypothetical protein